MLQTCNALDQTFGFVTLMEGPKNWQTQMRHTKQMSLRQVSISHLSCTRPSSMPGERPVSWSLFRDDHSKQNYFTWCDPHCGTLYPEICSDIYSGIQSDILSGILPGILCGILSGSLSDIYSDIVSGIPPDILSEIYSGHFI